MTAAVTNALPYYSYYNVLNSGAAASNTTAPLTATEADNSTASAENAPATTPSSVNSGPQLPADVVTLLQDYLSPGTSNPASALLGSSSSSDPLSALLDVSSYQSVLTQAYASAGQAQGTSQADPVESTLSGYQAAVTAYNNNALQQIMQAAAGGTTGQSITG